MWTVYNGNPTLLTKLCGDPLTEETIKLDEQFFGRVCKIKGDSVVEGRIQLITRRTQAECIPPTSDALQQHFNLAHYQTTVLGQACLLGSMDHHPTVYGCKKES